MKGVKSLMQNLTQYGKNLKSLTLNRNVLHEDCSDKEEKNLNGFSKLENLTYLKIRRVESPRLSWPVNLEEILNDCKGLEIIDFGTDDFMKMNDAFWRDFFTSHKSTFKRLHLENRERGVRGEFMVQRLGQLFDCENLEKFSMQFVKDIEIYHLIGGIATDFKNSFAKLSKVTGTRGNITTFYDWEFDFSQDDGFNDKIMEIDFIEVPANVARIAFVLLKRHVCESREIESLKLRCEEGIDQIEWSNLKKLTVEAPETKHEETLREIRENPEMVKDFKSPLCGKT